MKRFGLLVVATLFTAATAACGDSPTPTVAQPTPTATTVAATTTPPASPSVTPTTSAQTAIEFSVDGAGPYQLGATLTQLQAAPGLAEVKKGGETCPANTSARGVGTWADVRLSFRPDGKLYLAVNRSISIPTPSGAWLGTTLADLKKIYAAIPGKELAKGPNSAYLVTTLSGRGILFDLDSSKRVISMAAADGAFLKTSFEAGTDYC